MMGKIVKEVGLRWELTANCSEMCAHHCALLEYTTQHRTILTFFLLILQTIIIAQVLSTGGGVHVFKQLH